MTPTICGKIVEERAVVLAETSEEDFLKAVTWFNKDNLKNGPFQAARGINLVAGGTVTDKFSYFHYVC